MGYRQRSEAHAMGGLVGMLLIGAVLVALLILAIVVAVVTELWHIYRHRAFRKTLYSRILWSALAGLGIAWLLAALLASSPALSLGLVAWSFFLFTIVCIMTDWLARRHDPKLPDELALSDVVSWEPDFTPVH